MITTIHGKQERVRTVAVPPLALERLEPLTPSAPDWPYFVARTGQAWPQREARDSIAQLGRRTCIPLYPDTLRHSGAAIALAHGVDIEVFREMLGHPSSISTQRYLRTRRRLNASPTYAVAAAVAPPRPPPGQ